MDALIFFLACTGAVAWVFLFFVAYMFYALRGMNRDKLKSKNNGAYRN
jgi:cbb3-type cytochrome oxidase subunit 3